MLLYSLFNYILVSFKNLWLLWFQYFRNKFLTFPKFICKVLNSNSFGVIIIAATVYDTSERFAELEELSKTLDVKSKFERFKTLGTTQEQEQQLLEPVKR